MPSGKRFEFLENAPAKTLAVYLAREQAQTVAVVLSHLPPERAALVLTALPERLQAETIERLTNLGETDSEAIAILESELAAWGKARLGDSGKQRQRRETVTSILAAADANTRDAVVARLKERNPELAQRIQPVERERTRQPGRSRSDEYRIVQSIVNRQQVNAQLNSLIVEQDAAHQPAKSPPIRTAAPRIDFDQLIHLDSRMLAQLLEVADPNLLALALAGSKDELVERICDQMPKRIAKAFRREVRRMGPTRLSDVEAAQRAIADLAARQIALRRSTSHYTNQALIV
jgi:flagellar motor switch protein FliG